jgi:hypothetical protein
VRICISEDAKKSFRFLRVGVEHPVQTTDQEVAPHWRSGNISVATGVSQAELLDCNSVTKSDAKPEL